MPSLTLLENAHTTQLVGNDIRHEPVDYPGSKPRLCRVLDATIPDDYDNLEDAELVAEDPHTSEIITITGRDVLHTEFARIGEEYTIYYGEERTEDGDWERVTEKTPQRFVVRQNLWHMDTDGQTRIRSETYEAGAEYTRQIGVFVQDGSITIPGETDTTLPRMLLALENRDNISVRVASGVRFNGTITSVDEETLPRDGRNPSDVIPDGYTITFSDRFDGVCSITYQSDGSAYLTRDAPENPSSPGYRNLGPEDDPGAVSGKVLEIDHKHGRLEYIEIPWLEDLRQVVMFPEEFRDGSMGPRIGTAYTDPDDLSRLYHADIKHWFRDSDEDINDVITVDTPMTYATSH